MAGMAEVGGGINNNTVSSGAGGSSFISGYTGCNAINQLSTSTNITHTGQANYDSVHVFTNATITAGNASMPTQDGLSTMTGNTGNGYAIITFIKQ